MQKFELTNEEKLTIENYSLKQQVLDTRFAQLDAEMKSLRENNLDFWNKLSEKYGLDFMNKRISLNGNVIEVFDETDNQQ